ncbi:hypothetical protein CPB85DRAFT_1259732 [Mucidula mucida]|nr:hypothetical protein CPB85DRAFT_1259732 [Mucidula mucida]
MSNHVLCRTDIVFDPQVQGGSRLVGNWAQSNVSVLDSMLNKWFDSIPTYLRWDPNEILTLSSTNRPCCIALLQYADPDPQALHQPRLCAVIPVLGPLYQCREIMRAPSRGSQPTGTDNIFWDGGIVLSLNIWTKSKDKAVSGLPPREAEDLYRCMRVLDSSEKRYNICGRLVFVYLF